MIPSRRLMMIKSICPLLLFIEAETLRNVWITLEADKSIFSFHSIPLPKSSQLISISSFLTEPAQHCHPLAQQVSQTRMSLQKMENGTTKQKKGLEK